MAVAAPPRDLAAELRSEPPDLTIWSGRPGDILQGRLLGYQNRMTRFGEAKVAVIETDDSERFGVFLSRVLSSLFEAEHPRKHDRLAIAYDGKDSLKGYHRYRLRVQRMGELPPASVREECKPEVIDAPYAHATVAPPRRQELHPVGRAPAEPLDEDPFSDE